MRIEDLPEEPTIEDFKNLSKQELDRIPYDVLKAKCCFAGCKNGTTVRDYGFAPVFFLNRNSKAAAKCPKLYWMNFDLMVWYCGKHWQYLKRLGTEYVWQQYNIEKNIPVEVIKRVNQDTEFIEKKR